MIATSNTILERAQAYIAAIPGAASGSGGHDQTFAVACALVHGFALHQHEALVLLRHYNRKCQPEWSEPELLHKVCSARTKASGRPHGYLLQTAFHASRKSCSAPGGILKAHESTQIERVETFLKGVRCNEADLWEASPVRLPEDGRLDGIALVEALYEPSDLVNFVTAFSTTDDQKARPNGKGDCLGRDLLVAQWQAHGMPRSPAGGWLRMNPLDGGGIGDANVTAFRFALIECDGIPLDLQISLLARLPIPICAVLSSGGRSLHAWVRVDADNVDAYRRVVGRMLQVLSPFGIDQKNKNPSRLSRLPGVTRVIGATHGGRQKLLFLNPEPKEPTLL